MLKDATYKEKFAMLQDWMPTIIETVKKDLKADHLKNDWTFVRHYFPGKNPAKLSAEEMAPAYAHAIATGEKTEELAEFITNRWLLKHGDLYHYFEEELTKLNPDFSKIETIEKQASKRIMDDSVQQFGAIPTYLFCVLNSVVFPDEIYQALSRAAKQHEGTQQAEAVENQEKETIDSLKRTYEQQIARLTDKYEKKLLGLQKKYTLDVDILKKQVVSLQRKLSAS